MDPQTIGQAAVTRVTNAVSHISAQINQENTFLTMFVRGHLYEYNFVPDPSLKLRKRLQQWVILHRKVSEENAAHVAQIKKLADAMRSISYLRDDLAHGLLSFASCEFGYLIECKLERPSNHIWLRYPHKSASAPPENKTTVPVIFTVRYLDEVADSAGFLVNQLPNATAIAKQILNTASRGKLPDPGNQ